MKPTGLLQAKAQSWLSSCVPHCFGEVNSQTTQIQELQEYACPLDGMISKIIAPGVLWTKLHPQPNLYVEALTPGVTVFGDGAFGAIGFG